MVGRELVRGDRAAKGAGSEASDELIGGGAGVGAAGGDEGGIKVAKKKGADEPAGGVGVNAFDVDFIEAESGEAHLLKVSASKFKIPAFAGEVFESGFVWFEDKQVALFHPAFEGMSHGRGGGFDDTHGIEEGLVG